MKSALVSLLVALAACDAYDRVEYAALVTRDDAATATSDAAAAPPRDARSDAAAATPSVDAAPVPSVDAAVRCRASTVTDYCAAVPSLAQTPVLDGVLDCGLAMQPIATPAWADDAGVSVWFATASWSDGLYVFVEVREPTRHAVPDGTVTSELYCGDAIELFVDATGVFADGGYNQPGTTQFIVTAPTSDTEVSSRVGIRTGVWPQPGQDFRDWSAQLRAYPRVGGYVVEGLIAAADLGLTSWHPDTAGRIGFDLAVDVGSPPDGVGYACGGGLMHVAGFPLRAAPCDDDAGCGGATGPSANPAAFCTPRTVAP